MDTRLAGKLGGEPHVPVHINNVERRRLFGLIPEVVSDEGGVTELCSGHTRRIDDGGRIFAEANEPTGSVFTMEIFEQ